MDVSQQLIEELPSSKLGTKDYWDQFYSKELHNFDESKDEGEIWFGHARMMKVVKWMINNENVKVTDNILDIGCGNGVILLELSDEGFLHLNGVDYSSNAIQLAQKIAVEHNKNISYRDLDFLDPVSVQSLGGSYDVCHDKGTYDAISLRPDDAKGARQSYMDSLKHILKSGGYFIITSCNWTLDELKTQFSSDFKFVKHIPAPVLKFGGESGATVTTVVFSKE